MGPGHKVNTPPPKVRLNPFYFESYLFTHFLQDILQIILVYTHSKHFNSEKGATSLSGFPTGSILVLDMSPRESINYNVLSSIKFFNIEDRVKQLRLNRVYNIFNDRPPSYLRENFVLMSNVSTRHTRSSSNLDFVVPFIKTCQSGTFYYSGIKDWNELPKEVKVIKSKTLFKNRSKNCCSTRGFLGTIVNLYFTKRVSTFTLLITELFYQCVIIASLKM